MVVNITKRETPHDMPPDGNTIQPMMYLCQSMEPTSDQAPIKTQGAQGQRNILKEIKEM